MPGDFGGDEFAECIADGGAVRVSVCVIDRVGGEQVRGGVDGGVPVAEVDLGLAVDGANVLAAGVVIPGGVGAGVGPEFYGVFPVVASFGVAGGVGVPGAVGVVVSAMVSPWRVSQV